MNIDFHSIIGKKNKVTSIKKLNETKSIDEVNNLFCNVVCFKLYNYLSLKM